MALAGGGPLGAIYEIGALCALDDEGFNRQLTAAFDGRLGLCKVEGPRSAIPLTARYARDFARERLVLVGALVFHCVDTLAGVTMTQLIRPGAPVLFGGAADPVQIHKSNILQDTIHAPR